MYILFMCCKHRINPHIVSPSKKYIHVEYCFIAMPRERISEINAMRVCITAISDELYIDSTDKSLATIF